MTRVANPAVSSTAMPRVSSAWALTRALSPRPTARVAIHEIDGELTNEYAGSRRLASDAPEVPWAMYLAGTDRRFRYLAFDLDAKGVSGPADAARTATELAARLHAAGLSTVVCESGPSGGRHVWVALAESVDAATVATLARLLKAEYSCLDIAPLTNPVTGCVRPPGSPHRHGGFSEVIAGRLDALVQPTATADQVRELVRELAGTLTAAETPSPTAGPLPVDDHGRLYLPGARRALPHASAQALQEDGAAGDASATLWRVLIGAAAAHWRYADLAELAATSPGLEHVRSSRQGTGRTPRTPAEQTAVLRRQWDKAVRWVASSDRQIGDDPTFDPRAGALANLVRTVQERAQASVGRWSTRTGAADRRVLDALCALALEAVSTTVEADIRRLGMIAGISREGARRALGRLSEQGWISRTRAARGCRAAYWSIDRQGVIHRATQTGLSQADPRPSGAGSAERTLLLAQLTARLEDGRHDLFTPRGLGVATGNLYARTGTEEKSTQTLAKELGMEISEVQAQLTVLVSEGVVLCTPAGWKRPLRDRRDRAAWTRGVDGTLTTRAATYRLERAVWAWWLAEHSWMQQKSTSNRSESVLGAHTAAGLSTRGRYPRHRHSGRGDHHQARQLLAAGTTRIGTPITKDQGLAA